MGMAPPAWLSPAASFAPWCVSVDVVPTLAHVHALLSLYGTHCARGAVAHHLRGLSRRLSAVCGWL